MMDSHAINEGFAEQVILSKGDLLVAIQRDCATFFAFYLEEELSLEVPAVHDEVWEELLELLDTVNDPSFIVGTLKKLLAIPRGHAKTTLVKLAVILFLRYSRLSFCAYVSKTFSIALNALRDVKGWLESPQERELYGSPEVVKSSETEGLYIMRIRVPGQEKSKLIILKAFGQGTQIRGTIISNTRPDLLIFDDIEDQDTLEEKVQQKLDSWALGTAVKAMGKRGVVIFIGNMISKTTLLARLTKDPDWNPTVFGSIIRTGEGTLVPLWPGMWTLEGLLQDYANYRKIGQGHVWEAEMMNLTHQEVLGESLSNAVLVPMPNPEEVEGGFLCLDPAFGLKAWNDDSAITVHVKLKGMDIPCIVQSRVGKFKEEQLFDAMVELSYYWGLKTWVVEAVAAQRLLIPLFKMLSMQREIPPETFLFLPITGGKESKPARIVAFRNSVISKSYAIVEDELDLLAKLEEYVATSSEHDDLCDSAAFGTIVWGTYESVIKAQGRTDIAGAIMQGASEGGASAGHIRELQTCRF